MPRRRPWVVTTRRLVLIIRDPPIPGWTATIIPLGRATSGVKDTMPGVRTRARTGLLRDTTATTTITATGDGNWRRIREFKSAEPRAAGAHLPSVFSNSTLTQ